MVVILDHRDPQIAEEIYALQQASYAVERDLIDYPDFPPLRVTADDIRQERETFLGIWNHDQLAAVLSFVQGDMLLDIGRLIVHPSQFRRGHARTLLEAVEHYALPQVALTVSTAERNIPAVRLYESHGYRRSQRTVLPDGLVLVRFRKER